MRSDLVLARMLGLAVLTSLALWTVQAVGGPNPLHIDRMPATGSDGWTGTAAETGFSPGVPSGGTRDLAPVWTYAIGAPTLSSAQFADVDGDGVQDVVVSTYDPVDPYSAGRVFVFDVDGNILPGWPTVTSGPIPASPVIADVDNDGNAEIMVGSWQRAYLWNHDGTDYPGWPKTRGSYTSSAAADLDDDGDLEIVYCGTNRYVYVWQHDGATMTGWPFVSPELVESPGVADIDGDGELEIVAGTYQGPVGPDPFEVYVWNLDGTVAAGWPVATSGTVKATVALGDVDNDGACEIVACAYDTSNNDYLYMWDGAGNAKPGWPVRARYIRLSSPSLGDLDADGYLEVLVGGYSTSNREQVFAFNHDGSAVAGWPVELDFVGAHGNVNNSPIVANIDGDPAQVEVLVKARDNIFALHADGSIVDGFPFALSDENHTGTTSPTQAVGDVDKDGDVEYAFVSSIGNLAYFDEPHAYSETLAFWPLFKHDTRNTAHLPEAELIGDVDGDGDVDLSDLAALLATYGLCDGDAGYDPAADFDADDCVTLADLAALLANYGVGT